MKKDPLKKYVVVYIDQGTMDDPWPQAHQEIFDTIKEAKEFIKFDIRNLNEFYDCDKNPYKLVWDGNHATAFDGTGEKSSYNICPIDLGMRTQRPF